MKIWHRCPACEQYAVTKIKKKANADGDLKHKDEEDRQKRNIKHETLSKEFDSGRFA